MISIRKGGAWAGAVALAAALLAPIGVAAPAAAETAPIPLGETVSGSSITTLMAGSAQLSGGPTVNRPTLYPKHFWVDGFAPGASARWATVADEAQPYQVTAMIAGGAGQQWRVSSAGDSIEFSLPHANWSRVDLGELDIAAEDEIVLEPLDGVASAVKSLELVPADEWDALQARAAEFRGSASATRDEFSEKDWGLFFQYGPWSYPETGATKLGLEEITDQFDVEYFADWVEELGAEYVVWSVSWWTYELQMPNDAVDAIMGNGNRTAERDLVGEIAAELKSRGLMFFLYYHTGQDEHLGYGSTDFWAAQQWPNPEFTLTASGDRSVFLNNWKAIIREIGASLGTDLDGWFFDDGLLYYPADFEDLGQAAREGNPARLLSYNGWIVSSYTPFQDVNFGEDCIALPGRAPAGGDGVHPSGPYAGLLEQCMIRTENDWGVKEPNQQIAARFSAESLACIVAENRERNVPTTLGAMMWSPTPGDPTSREKPSPRTIEIYQEMTRLLEAPATLSNNTDPRVNYSGSWGYAGGRGGAGDHCSDVHYSNELGASATLSFEGTGARILGPIQNPVIADVYVDGEFFTSISESRAQYSPQQVLVEVNGLPRGEHTIEIRRTGGDYLQIDAFAVEDLVAEVVLSEPTATAEGCMVTVLDPDESAERTVMTSAGSAVIDEAGRVTVTGLAAGETATVTVTSSRPGYADGSAVVSCTALAETGPGEETPGEPGSVTVKSEIGQVSVAWAAPDPAGAGEVSGYEVEVRDTDGSSVIAGCETTGELFCTVDRLTDGETYAVSVRALSASGPGPWSSTAMIVVGDVRQAALPDARDSDDLTVSDRTPQRGATITITALGFRPGSQVDFWLHSEPVLLGSSEADAQGEATITVALPADAAGAHTVQALGVGPVTGDDRNLARTLDIQEAAVPGSGGSAGGGLALTGGDAGTAIAMLGGALLLIGSAALWTVRRRREV